MVAALVMGIEDNLLSPNPQNTRFKTELATTGYANTSIRPKQRKASKHHISQKVGKPQGFIRK